MQQEQPKTWTMVRNLALSSRLLINSATRELRLLEITGTQAQVFSIIASCENSSQESIAKELQIARTAVGLSLKQLIDAGFVSRTADENDKRIHRLGLTQKGEALFPKLNALILRKNEQALAALTEYERIVFLGLLQKVSDQCEAEFGDKRKFKNDNEDISVGKSTE